MASSWIGIRRDIFSHADKNQYFYTKNGCAYLNTQPFSSEKCRHVGIIHQNLNGTS